MFKVKNIEHNHLDIELSGKLNSKEMKIALDEMESKAEGIEDGIMLYGVVEFHLPSLGAIAIEFSRLPSMFGLTRKFRKDAVLIDKNWIQKASEFEGVLIPGIQIKAFNRDQRSEAESWLSETG